MLFFKLIFVNTLTFSSFTLIRNLHCRYSLVVTRSVVALDLNSFDVDGLRCDNLLLCFPRPLTKDPADCPYDRVKVYDGPNEDSPLIVTLCGKKLMYLNLCIPMSPAKTIYYIG